MENIPLLRPALPPLEGEFLTELQGIWSSGTLMPGPRVARFEAAVRETLGVPEAVAVSSCTSGLILTLDSFGAQGEVIVPSYTWTATAQAVLWCGLEPVFADIDRETLTLDPGSVEAAISPRTRAIMPVTVFGCPPDIAGLQEVAERHRLHLMFDSAQGLGSKYRGRFLGGFGEAEVFSMSPTKTVTAMAGGLVTTRNPELAARIRRARDYGRTATSDFDVLSLSAHMNEVCGLVARMNFERMEHYIQRREEITTRYRQGLASVPGLSFQRVPADCRSNWNYFVVRVDPKVAPISRDALYARLEAHGIASKKYFFPAVHQQTLFRDRPAPRLPETEAAAAQCLALPLFHALTDDAIDRIVGTIRSEMKS